MRIHLQLLSTLVLLALGVVRAQEPAAIPAPERLALDFTHCWGGSKGGCDSEGRAGWPQWIACWAKPGESPAFIGYYVGGGSACRGECRDHAEGTWGWDYQGHCLPRRVALLWTHGRRYQEASNGPGQSPDEAHPDRAANASEQVAHERVYATRAVR